VRLRPETVTVLDADGRTFRQVDGTRVLFPSPFAPALRDPSNLAGDLREVLDELGYDWVTSHTFRKSVATRLDEAGWSGRQVADQLGHANPSMTLDVYFGRKVINNDAASALER
jgi:integrase